MFYVRRALEREMNKEAQPSENLPEGGLEERIAHIRKESYTMANHPVNERFIAWKGKADAGDIEAQIRVARAYLEGVLVEKSEKKATRYYEMAAGQGNAEAQYQAAVCLWDCVSGASDEKIFDLLKCAADQGHIEAIRLLAVYYFDDRIGRKFPNMGEKCLLYAAHHGSVKAQRSLGYRYMFGNGVQKSEKKGFKWYKIAAERGDPEANYEVGRCFERETGVEKSDEEAFKSFKIAADLGHKAALLRVVQYYQDGKGVEQSDEMAFKYYLRLADQDEWEGFYGVAECYRLGRGVEQSDEKAFEYYKKVDHNRDAQLQLAKCYQYGIGVERSLDKSLEYYCRADASPSEKEFTNLCATMLKRDQQGAELGIPEFQHKLAMRYLEGEGVEKSDETAMHYLKLAAGQKHPQAIYELGCSFSEKGEYTKAFDLFMLAAKRGFVDAYFRLGEAYLHGWGVEQSDEKAFKYYSLSEKGGHKVGCFSVGVCLQEGWGALKSNEIANQYLRSYDIWNHPDVPYRLGKILMEGKRTPKSDSDAFFYFEGAAQKGSAKGALETGRCYAQGIGTERSDTKAFNCYMRAAELGNSNAKVALGRHYKEGIGIDPNPILAFKCFKAGYDQGNREAISPLIECYTKGIGTKKSESTVIQLYKELVGFGEALAQFEMGNRYREGRGVEQSDDLALEYYLKAAEQRHPESCLALAKWYATDEVGIQYLEIAADQGLSEALHELGRRYQWGRGVKRCDEKASEYYRVAADQGLSGAELALFQSGLFDKKEALRYCEKAAGQSNLQALFELGLYLENLHGGKYSDGCAFDYFKQAADLGHYQALCKVAACYGQGIGVERSEELAFDYYYRSKEQRKRQEKPKVPERKVILDRLPPRLGGLSGEPEVREKESADWKDRWAQFGKECSYEAVKPPSESTVRSLPKDEGNSNWKTMLALSEKGERAFKSRDPLRYEKSFKFYKMAADMGSYVSQFVVGLGYQFGRGVEQSDEMAFIYYRLAADQGLNEAIEITAEWYRIGRGTEPSDCLSARYCRMVADQGNLIASFLTGKHYRDGVGVTQSHRLAAYYFEKGAQAGDVEPLVALANAYWEGLGVNRSIETALSLFELALDDDIIGRWSLNDVIMGRWSLDDDVIGRCSRIFPSHVHIHDLKNFIEGLDAFISDLSDISFYKGDYKAGTWYLRVSNSLQAYRDQGKTLSGSGFLRLFKKCDLIKILKLWRVFEKSSLLSYSKTFPQEVFFLLEKPWRVCETEEALNRYRQCYGSLLNTGSLSVSQRLARQLKLLEVLENAQWDSWEKSIKITMGGDDGQRRLVA